MGLLKKKNKKALNIEHDYTKTESEFVFLNLIMSRKKNITKEFFINVFAGQQNESDYIKDEDIEKIILKIVSEIIEEIGENYKNYLIKYYFGTKENLIKYISEDVYVDLIADAVMRNNKKAVSILTSKTTNIISKLNQAQ